MAKLSPVRMYKYFRVPALYGESVKGGDDAVISEHLLYSNNPTIREHLIQRSFILFSQFLCTGL